MKELTITQIAADKIRIDGYPDGIKVIALKDSRARSLANLRLHYMDLAFAWRCLDALERTTNADEVTQSALWRSAVIYFAKCFGDNQARGNLMASKVFKGQRADVWTDFDYFKSLRNKHLVHDANPFNQCDAGAGINAGNKSHKIEVIACIVQVWEAAQARKRPKLRRLIDLALAWVTTRYDELEAVITKELEAHPHADLMAREVMKLKPPTDEDVGATRAR